MSVKKPLKILAWTAGSIVALLILLVVGLRLFLPAEKLRDLAVAHASTSLGRPVTVQDVRVSLSGGLGIRLTDVAVGNPAGFPAGNLMTAENVDLKLRIRPLFSRQVHADRLVINTPHIRLVRLDSGRNNFTFGTGKARGPVGGDDTAEGAEAALDFDRFECHDGILGFRDEDAGNEFEATGLDLDWTVNSADGGRLACSGRTEADSLKISGKQSFAAGFATLTHTARIDPGKKRLFLEKADLALAGLDFTATGEAGYDPDSPGLRGEIDGKGLDLGAILALVATNRAGALDGIKVDGHLDLHATFSFDPNGDTPLTVNGSWKLAGGPFELPDLPEPVATVSGAGDFDLDTFGVTSFEASSPGVDLGFTGKVTGLTQPAEAKVEGTARLNADLSRLKDYLPAEREADLAGKAAGTIRLAGRLDSPDDLPTGGEITVTDLSYRDAHIFEPVTDLNAVLAFGPRDVTIKNCAVKLQPSNFTLSGVVKDAVPAMLGEAGAEPHLEFAMNAPLLNVDHIFPAASPGAAQLEGATGKPGSLVMADFPDFTGSGTVAIADLIYGGVTFTDITGKVDIADRIVAITDAAGRVYAGEVTGTSTIDLNHMENPGYRGSFAAQAIQADSLLSRFTPLKNHLFGALDFQGEFAAAGKDPEAFRQSLILDAHSSMTQGRLITSGVVQQGLNTLAVKLGRTFDREEKLKDLAGPVKVSDGRVVLERFTAEVPGLGALSIGGSYGFPGDLDFRGDLLLTEDNSRKLLGSTGNSLTGAFGNLLGKKEPATTRLRLPVTIGGTFTRPDVALDFSALARTQGQAAVDDLKGKLEGMFGN